MNNVQTAFNVMMIVQGLMLVAMIVTFIIVMKNWDKYS